MRDVDERDVDKRAWTPEIPTPVSVSNFKWDLRKPLLKVVSAVENGSAVEGDNSEESSTKVEEVSLTRRTSTRRA